MNSPATSARPEGRRYTFHIGRVLLCGVFLSVLVAACLYIWHAALPFLTERMAAEDKKHSPWIAEQLAFALPLFVIPLFQYLVYHKHDRRDGVAAREMFWEVVVVAVLVYGVMLPYLNHLSHEMYAAAVEAGARIPKTDGGVAWTLMMKLHDWFIRQAVTLSVLLVFHAQRARREALYGDEPEETYMTREEYEALTASEQEA